MIQFGSVLPDFLLAFSAFFSIINPLGSAFIFGQATEDRSHRERQDLAGKVGFYSAVVMLTALWGGAYVLQFFGVTIHALRIAGGLVVAVRAWDLLSKPELNEERKQQQASTQEGASEIAFFPLTMPFTAGPGTISVAIALGSNLPADRPHQITYVFGASGAAVVVAAMVWVAYRSADSLLEWIGHGRVRVLSRLFAFMLLCLGTQITLNGAAAVPREALRP